MNKYQSFFKRKEIKFLISEEQYNQLMNILKNYAAVDDYGETTIANIYYDTPDFRLIRTSLEKPKYKEKLRLRCYGTLTEGSTAFVEIKKKYKGVVYKRRVKMDYEQAFLGLAREHFVCNDGSFRQEQIGAEIAHMLYYYKRLAPAMCVFYDRIAMQGKEDPELRITFDRNIRWRTTGLDLRLGYQGEGILESGQRIMEIKVRGSIPLYLCRVLCDLGIYKTSFSKYGKCYQHHMKLKNDDAAPATRKGEKENDKRIA